MDYKHDSRAAISRNIV